MHLPMADAHLSGLSQIKQLEKRCSWQGAQNTSDSKGLGQEGIVDAAASRLQREGLDTLSTEDEVWA